MKNFMFACVGACALACAFYFAALGAAQLEHGAGPTQPHQDRVVPDAEATKPTHDALNSEPARDTAGGRGGVTVTQGRWTIVNGTPEQARNIMLLDTATGETWVVCESADGSTGWCRLERSDSRGTSPKPEPSGK